MAGRPDGFKHLRPDEQLLELVRTVARLEDQMRFTTRLQGMRLETRVVGTERHLYAVVNDPTATNNGVAYPLTP